MPIRAKAPCRVAGCRKYRRPPLGYCEDHTHLARKPHTHNNRRTERDPLYNSVAWNRAKRHQRSMEPLCRECKAAGTLVDHIVPINEGGDPFSQENLQTLCDRCHNRKRAQESHRARQRAKEQADE